MEHRLRHPAPGVSRAVTRRLASLAVLWAAAGLGLARGEGKFAPPPADIGSTPPVLEIRPLADAQLARAASLYEQKNYEAALPAYVAVLPSLRDARRQEALLRIGECYRVLGRQEEALGVYKMLAESSAGSLFVAVADYQRGRILYQQGKWGSALEMFQAAQAANPDAATKEAARFFTAACQVKMAQGKEKEGAAALQSFADAKPAGPYTAAAAQMLAEAAEKAGDWAAAAKDWQAAYAASQEKPIRAQASARAALALLRLDRPAEAEKLFLASRQADEAGDYARISNTGLLDLYFRQKRYQEVVSFFDANRDKLLDSGRAAVLLEVARSQAALKDWPRAIEYFDLYLGAFKDAPDAPAAAYERLLARAQISQDNVAGDTAAFLAAYPKAPQVSGVLFLRAQQYSAKQQFAEAAPIWDQLAQSPPEGLPAAEIYFEAPRAHAALKEWKAAADGFALFIQKFSQHASVQAAWQARAVALQNLPDAAGAAQAWAEVLKLAEPKSPDAQEAAEQLAVLDGRLDRHAAFITDLERIHRDFPQSRLWPMATYTLGAEAFSGRYYKEAEPLLRQARTADPKNWNTAALYRLLWIAYQQKDAARAAELVKEYDALEDPKAKEVRVPAEVYYWLGTAAVAAHRDAEAASWFALVTTHPQGGAYISPAWWELGEAQRRQKLWPLAVQSYDAFRARDAKNASNPQVLLALADAQTGAGLYSLAKEHLDQVLLAQPEGKLNAQARFLTGEWHFAQKQYGEALKSFATLSLIYRDNDITPRALERAAQSAELFGDKAQAESLRKKLQADYPDFQPQEGP
ncbi:MAG: tetratricopeptide repeat protein [Verrucomicrobium sp.]|nr:tetratricopeptide repeat protein [Verrucomicrobium sp.]